MLIYTYLIPGDQLLLFTQLAFYNRLHKCQKNCAIFCDIELIEDTILHISDGELIRLESVAPDENSISVHPQKRLCQSSATEWMEWS